MDMKPNLDEIFGQRIPYPDCELQDRLACLVGLNEQKISLAKILGLLVNPHRLKDWAKKYHQGAENILNIVLRRPPLVVLAGDVGSGKTEMAETIGDAVARQERIDITLFPLSLATRGQGRVGEMTKLISMAFDHILHEAKKLSSTDDSARGAVILLVDEADALAQSREASQMHHEDRSGVNAFIRGVDQIANAKVPAAIIMCTNRLNALDPAVRRRAADIFEFSRPDDTQRHLVLSTRLEPLGLSPQHLNALVDATGLVDGVREYGFTYSDLTQRLIPALILDAYPSRPVDGERAIEMARTMAATPPFQDLSAKG